MTLSAFRPGPKWIAAALAVAMMLPMSVALAAAGEPKNAAFYKQQWNMKAIRAHAAFSTNAEAIADAADGSRQVLVAVLDTGIDYEHPDLDGLVDLSLSKRMAFPTVCEVEPGVAEPGMPYVPIRGFDMQLLDERLATPLGKREFMDFHSHGTAIAGLVASNAQYLAGLTQRTTLFSVKVHGMSRQNCLGVYLAGIKYAADNGADVIHLSIPLEFSMTTWPGARERVNEALDYAHAKGAVLVAAAGNNPAGGVDLDEDPNQFRFCEGNHVVCVSATGPTSAAETEEPTWDRIAAYSHFGNDIDVAGPGGTAAVPVTLTCSTNTRFSMPPQAPCRPPISGKTWTSTGTSFGAGATSGLAALIFRVAGTDDPDTVVDIIEESADDLGVLGEDRLSGFGRINVKQAVDMALALP